VTAFQLINKIYHAGGLGRLNDHAISPVIRQTLQHWGYVLGEVDYKERIKSHRPK
jgi:hypothetical protein